MSETNPPAPAPDGPTEVDKAIEAAFAASKDASTFYAALDEQGLILAIVTAGDIAALAAETVRSPQRKFPVLTVGELVAVDRFGDVHDLTLAPDAEAAMLARIDSGSVAPPSVTAAQAVFAHRHAPRPARRKAAATRAKLVHVRNSIEQAATGDRGELASALRQMASLHEDAIPSPTVADHLRDAMRAIAGGKTTDAHTALASAYGARLADPEIASEEKPDPVLSLIGHATKALSAGDRSAAMDVIEEAIEKTEGGERWK